MHAGSTNHIADILNFTNKYINKLFQNPESIVNEISRNNFPDLPNLTTKE